MYQPYQTAYNMPFQSYPSPNPYQAQTTLLAQPAALTGHTIGSHEEITASDVPMNGAPAYFPTQDGSAIYAKQWNPNGSITTLRYVPEISETKGEEQTPTLFDIMNQLDTIQDLLKAERKPAARRTKKEAEDDAS